MSDSDEVSKAHCGGFRLCPALIRINGIIAELDRFRKARDSLIKRRQRKRHQLTISYLSDNPVSFIELVKSRRLQNFLNIYDNPDKKPYHRRSQRARHALEAGMTKHFKTGDAKFLTLTSPEGTYPHTINPHWEILKKRIQRRLGHKFPYCKLRTTEGRGVIHAIIITPRINIEWIRENWLEIHGAYKVWITEIYRWDTGLTNYLASYLQGQGTRLSYTWDWFRKGWAGAYRKTVKRLKNHYQLLKNLSPIQPPFFCISAFTKWWFRVYEPPLFEWFLAANHDEYAEFVV